MTARLSRELELALRAATAEPARAHEAAEAFIAAFDPSKSVDPRVYAAFVAAHGRIQVDAGPDDARWNLIRGAVRKTWTHNQVRLAALQPMFLALERVDADVVVLPGALTAIAALDGAGARVLDRVDVLVRPEHVPRATAALLALGAAVEHGHALLVDSGRSWLSSAHAELSGVAVVLRWHHPLLAPDVVESWRARLQRVAAGPLESATLADADARVVVLAGLTDTEAAPTAWTNLVLELARLNRALGDGESIDTLAATAHEVGRHGAWEEQLRLVAHVSARESDARTAERFAAVPAPAPTSAANGSAPRTSRAMRLLRDFRAEAVRRQEPMTARGFARYLRDRWRIGSRRRLPSELVRRLGRSRGRST